MSNFGSHNSKLYFELEYQREAPIFLYYIWLNGQVWCYEKLLKMDVNLAKNIFAIYDKGFEKVYTPRDNIKIEKNIINGLGSHLLSAIIDSYVSDFHALASHKAYSVNKLFIGEMVGKFITVFLLGDMNHALQKDALAARIETETLFSLIHQTLQEKFPENKFIDVCSYDEIIAETKLDSCLASDRRHSLLTFNGIVPLSENQRELYGYLTSQNIQIVESRIDSHKKIITGCTASRGKAVGSVRIVQELADLDKVESGDVLVSTMTSPDYVPAMKKVVAIVTDEGGVTSHAAIVARELGIPCIVGTKVATKTLANGDKVEVNATDGKVIALN